MEPITPLMWRHVKETVEAYSLLIDARRAVISRRSEFIRVRKLVPNWLISDMEALWSYDYTKESG